MSGKWFMVRGGRVWHYTAADEGPRRRYLNRQRGRVALCGVVDDGQGMGRVNAPDCAGCMRRMARGAATGDLLAVSRLPAMPR